MLKMLNNIEISHIAGGWTCNSTYKGELFQNAVWVTCLYDAYTRNEHSEKFGFCNYGASNKLFYLSPKNLLRGIEQELAFWAYDGDFGRCTCYKCYESNATRCVFKE